MSVRHLLPFSILATFAILSVFLFSHLTLESKSQFHPDDNSPPASFYPCPIATQEKEPQVSPVISPTNLMVQTIYAEFYYAETMDVTLEGSTFRTQCIENHCSVTILLKPNTINNLQVDGYYKHIYDSNGCHYGGYSISTYQDRLGNPLEIQQVGGFLYSVYLTLVNR